MSLALEMRMLRGELSVVGWIALACLTGCYPATELARPRIVTPGRVQVALALAPQVVPTMDADRLATLAPQLGLRAGLADRVDLGLRLSFASVELGPRVALVRSERTGEFDLTLGAVFTRGSEGFPGDDAARPSRNVSWVGARVPIMLGYRGDDLSPWVSLTTHLGTAESNDVDDGTIDHGAYVMLSTALGLDIKLHDWVTMQLQLAYLQPLAGIDAPDARLGPDDHRLAAQLGFHFGLD